MGPGGPGGWFAFVGQSLGQFPWFSCLFVSHVPFLLHGPVGQSSGQELLFSPIVESHVPSWLHTKQSCKQFAFVSLLSQTWFPQTGSLFDSAWFMSPSKELMSFEKSNTFRTFSGPTIGSTTRKKTIVVPIPMARIITKTEATGFSNPVTILLNRGLE